MVKVLLFAGLAQRAGAREVEWPIGTDAVPLESLLNELQERYPFLAGYPYAIAINGEYVDRGDTIKAGDEVALIPPVSGG